MPYDRSPCNKLLFHAIQGFLEKNRDITIVLQLTFILCVLFQTLQLLLLSFDCPVANVKNSVTVTKRFLLHTVSFLFTCPRHFSF